MTRPCVTGAPGGLAQACASLSPGYRRSRLRRPAQDGGLIVITFDGDSDSAACCGQASGFGLDDPNVPDTRQERAGGRIGAVLLSLVRPGAVSTAMSLGSTR